MRSVALGRVFSIMAAVLVMVGLFLLLGVQGTPARRYPERIPVRFWHLWTAEWKTVVDRIVARFNESQSKYEVISLSVPGTAADSKFLLAVAGGDPPDVMAQWNQVIPKWAESGLIVPLNKMMSDSEWTSFKTNTYPAAQKIGIFDGNLYAVSTGLDAYACFCRVQDLRECGLAAEQYPKTLEELAAWGERLCKWSEKGRLTRIGYLPTMLAMYAPGFGEGFFDWQRGLVTLNTPGNRKALSFLVDERKKLGFDNVLQFESGLNVGAGSAQWPFISGSYSITVDGQWRIEQIAQYAPELEYVVFPIPAPRDGHERYGWVNGNFMVIPQGARHPDGAWEFIKFWSGLENPERAAEFYAWGGWLPTSPAVASAPVYVEYVKRHPAYKTFLDILPSEYLQPPPPVSYQIYLWDRIQRAEESALRGVLTPSEALARLEQEMSREIETRRSYGYTDNSWTPSATQERNAGT